MYSRIPRRDDVHAGKSTMKGVPAEARALRELYQCCRFSAASGPFENDAAAL